jgi:hypothetical protein
VVQTVVAAEALDHAERVGRALEELGEHQVVESEPRAPGRLRAQIARPGVDLIGSPRQDGRESDGGRLGAGPERGTSRVPPGGLLVGMADAQDGLLTERPAEDLLAMRGVPVRSACRVVRVMNACVWPSYCSMRWISASTSSTGDSLRVAIRFDSSAID